MNKLLLSTICILVPMVASAGDNTAQLQHELKQANEIVKGLQKQYNELKQRNSELEKENAYLGNQIILREAEIQTINANCGKAVNKATTTAVQREIDPQVQAQRLAVSPVQPKSKPKPSNVPEIGQLTPVHDLTLFVGADGAELHTGPGDSFPRLLKLQEGARLNVDAMRDDWLRVLTIGGIVGFVHKEHTTTKPAVPKAEDGQEPF